MHSLSDGCIYAPPKLIMMRYLPQLANLYRAIASPVALEHCLILGVHGSLHHWTQFVPLWKLCPLHNRHTVLLGFIAASTFVLNSAKRRQIPLYRPLYITAIWICAQIHVKGNNSWILIFISHLKWLHEKEGKTWNSCVHVRDLSSWLSSAVNGGKCF